MAESLSKTLGLAESESSMASYWMLEVRKEQWEHVAGMMSGAQLSSSRVLEIGCGLGLFVLVGNLLGFDCYGTEASASEYEGSVAMARELLHFGGISEERISCGEGERLKYPDRTFDMVCSFQTLEHVNHPSRVLAEAFRVLAPQGKLFFTCPNYLYPYEAHYGLGLPLPLGRVFSEVVLKMRKRPTDYLRTIQWINPQRLRQWCIEAGFVDIDVNSIGVGLLPQKSLNIVPTTTLPYRFLRGDGEHASVENFLRLPVIRTWARRHEVYPQISCCARRP